MMTQHDKDMQERNAQISALRGQAAALEGEVKIVKASLESKDKASANALEEFNSQRRMLEEARETAEAEHGSVISSLKAKVLELTNSLQEMEHKARQLEETLARKKETAATDRAAHEQEIQSKNATIAELREDLHRERSAKENSQLTEQQQATQWNMEKSDLVSKARMWEQRCIEAEEGAQALKKRLEADLQENVQATANLQSQLQALRADSVAAKASQEQALREEQEHSSRLLSAKDSEIEMLKV